MNIRKNFEALFLLAAVLGLAGSWVTSEPPVASNVSKVYDSAALDPAMQVVVIKGKRLSAAEKAALA